MQYFKNLKTQEVFGYDDTQQDLIAVAVADGWEDVTGSWPPPSQPPTPIEITQVTKRQARLALLQENLLDDVEAMITTREQKIWWEDSVVYEKYNPLCQQIGTALNLDLTALFNLAITL